MVAVPVAIASSCGKTYNFEHDERNSHLAGFWTNSFSWAYRKATFLGRRWKLSEVWWESTARNRFQRMARGELTWKLAWHISHRMLPKCCLRLRRRKNKYHYHCSSVKGVYCTVQGVYPSCDNIYSSSKPLLLWWLCVRYQDDIRCFGTIYCQN